MNGVMPSDTKNRKLWIDTYYPIILDLLQDENQCFVLGWYCDSTTRITMVFRVQNPHLDHGY